MNLSSAPIIAVTGAAGFVGHALCAELLQRGYAVRACVHQRQPAARPGLAVYACGDLAHPHHAVLQQALTGVDTVVHAAARVHVMSEKSHDALAEFRRSNVVGTMQLAQLAARAGVRRFIFISSIKVNGDVTRPGQAFTEASTPQPMEAYGQSKYEAEQALFAWAANTEMDVVVIRPPLIYGAGVTGNFLRMLSWLSRGIPLPLAAVHNQRSVLGVGNLVDLIIMCITHPAAAQQVFLAADAQFSTPELLRQLGDALGQPARLFSVPTIMLRAAAMLTGQGMSLQRLCSDLDIDTHKIRTLLGWQAPVSVEEGLRKTVQAFLRSK